MSAPNGYSRSQIWLHWIVVVLIAVQFLFHDPIAHAWYGAMRRGEPVTFSAGIALHVVTGVLVLVLVIWRLALRASRGTPPPVGDSPVQNLVAGLVHWALYLVLILMAFSGLAAWFGMVGFAGEVHGLLKGALLILIGVHVLGALYHQFILRDTVMARMKRPAD